MSSQVVQFPLLPEPTRMPEASFRRVLLAWVLTELEGREAFMLPRREAQMEFNRSNGRLVSKHLAGLVGDGWLVSFEDDESDAYWYVHGRRLARPTALRKDWLDLADGLWGQQGLLRTYEDVAALSHGMPGINGMLVLSTLARCESPISSGELHQYLCSFMKRPTVVKRLNRLINEDLAKFTADGYVATDDWRAELDKLVATSKAGALRSEKICDQVERDRSNFSEFRGSGRLTPKERKWLRRQPCVRCGGRSSQVEHFPPKKFDGFDHRHTAFAICEQCNNDTSGFIKRLPWVEPLRVTETFIADGVDPGDLLRASVEKGLRRFYRAFKDGDVDAALLAIQIPRSLCLDWKAKGPIPWKREPGTARSRGSRTSKGKAAPRTDSRLPY